MTFVSINYEFWDLDFGNTSAKTLPKIKNKGNTRRNDGEKLDGKKIFGARNLRRRS